MKRFFGYSFLFWLVFSCGQYPFFKPVDGEDSDVKEVETDNGPAGSGATPNNSSSSYAGSGSPSIPHSISSTTVSAGLPSQIDLPISEALGDESDETATDFSADTVQLQVVGGHWLLSWENTEHPFSRVTFTQGEQTVIETLGRYAAQWAFNAADLSRFRTLKKGDLVAITVEFSDSTVNSPAGMQTHGAEKFTAVNLSTDVPQQFMAGSVVSLSGNVKAQVNQVKALVLHKNGELMAEFPADLETDGSFKIDLRPASDVHGDYLFAIATDLQPSVLAYPIEIIPIPKLDWQPSSLLGHFRPTFIRSSSWNKAAVAIEGYQMQQPVGALVNIKGTALKKIDRVAYIEKPNGSVEMVKLKVSDDKIWTLEPGMTFELDITFSKAGSYKLEINEPTGLAAFNQPVYVGNRWPVIYFGDWYVKTRDIDTTPIETLGADAAIKTWLRIINVDRAAMGLNPVVEESLLKQAAMAHCQDMRARKFFAHVTPTGETPGDRATASGWQFGVSENLAQGYSVADLQIGLLESAGHRMNILTAGWTRVGLGISVWKDSPGPSISVGAQMFSFIPK